MINKIFKSYLFCAVIFLSLLCSEGISDTQNKKKSAKLGSNHSLVNVFDLKKLGLETVQPENINNQIIVEALRKNRKTSRPIMLYAYKPSHDTVQKANEVLEKGYTIREYPPFSVQTPINWKANPYKDKNWQYQIACLRPIRPLLSAWKQTRNPKYLDPSRRVMLDWISYHLVQNNDHKFRWHDMSAGLRADKLAYLISQDLHSNTTDQDEMTLMLYAAVNHLNYLANPRNLTYNNHGLFQVLGLASLCNALPEIQLYDHFQKHIDNSLSRLLRLMFSEEGIQLENSSQYHLFLCKTLQQFKKTEHFKNAVEFNKIAEKANSNIVYFFHPNGDSVQIGDSDRDLAKNYIDFHPYVRYVATHGKEGQCPQRSSVVFSKSGYAILRSPWDVPFEEQAYVFMTGSYHTVMHKQPDDLSFEWSEKGLPILVNSGKYSYGSGALKQVFCRKRTRSNNTIEIDEKDYPSQANKYRYGSAIKYWSIKDSIQFVEGRIARPYWGIQQKRILFFKPGKWLCVLDELNSDDSHSYKQWFHFHETIQVAHENKYLTINLPSDSGNIYLYDLTNQAEQVELVKGQEEPYLQGWISPLYEEFIPRYSTSLLKKGKDVLFVTLFSVDQPLTNFRYDWQKDKKLHVQWESKDHAYQESFEYVYQSDGSPLLKEAVMNLDKKFGPDITKEENPK